MRPLTVAYRGNFGVDFSTESHVAATLASMGHRVVRIQESDVDWSATVACCKAEGADMFLWTQTYGFQIKWGPEHATRALGALGAMMPTVGFHLDRWWDLEREAQITTEPFFQRLRWVFTADGDNQGRFAAAGVPHRWLPPAVFREECRPGWPRPALASDVAFVGSWRGYGHEVWWPQRKAVLDYLRRRYGTRFRMWPQPGQPVRGQLLNDLYASVAVVVGDSCFADRSDRYISDRAFETVGRGGFLVMPCVQDVAADMLTDGVHCRWYDHGDLAQLGAVVDHALGNAGERERIRKVGQEHVTNHHTYTNRMAQLLATVNDEGGCGW